MKIARTVVALAAAAGLAAGCSTPAVTSAYQHPAHAEHAKQAAPGAAATLRCATADDRYGCLFSFANPAEVSAPENEVALVSALRRQIEIEAADGAAPAADRIDLAALAAACRQVLRAQHLLSWRSTSEVYVPMQSLLGLLYDGKAVATDTRISRQGRRQRFRLRYALR
ncbi:MAG: hypothetical protein KGL18_00775 [Burkholderiales bacterium]|nr:hypothetical protein [Burkholderiales bacterium]MDE1929070.1 hypothetical protein [Burkholderiales bacterium]MDE2158875.1 hypothetical protein [Burkholderiales bacterium]MDE2501495.1 hypothetical protein [Burkholderiales bacterium]